MISVFRRSGFVVVSGLVLYGCGGGHNTDQPTAPGVFEPGIGGRGAIVRGGMDVNGAFGQGIDLKGKGDCKAAVAKLRPVANIGPGYENAQTALGECLVQMAGSTDMSSDYLDGMTWISRAADAGWPEAQFDLAQIYAFGPSTLRHGSEAAYWLALYDANSGKSRIGFVAPDPATEKSIRAELTAADIAEGQRRAAQWQRKVWLPATAGGAPGLSTREIRQFGAGTVQP